MSQKPALPVQYLRNPDVVLREEDENGGLLFNPDTNQVKIVNPTGLFIWKQCANPSDPQAIARTLQQAFDEVPEGELLADVQEFLAEMVQSGFIGVVESA